MKILHKAILDLQNGRVVQLCLAGNSMTPRVKSGQVVIVNPVTDPKELKVGQVVLCKVRKKVYLHLIKALEKDRVQIGNNHGRINGWTHVDNVYGIMGRKPKYTVQKLMQVGTVVKLKVSCLGNEAGTRGVCFHVYQLGDLPPGGQVIFENGNYDGFSVDEQEQFLEIIENTSFRYEFKHVIKLGQDFEASVFDFIKQKSR